jgi:hypothetical protein
MLTEVCVGQRIATPKGLSDSDIRVVLRSQIVASDHSADGELIEELGICCGQVRVDLALVNGSIHGYEIKSDRDSLRRLTIQAKFYGRVLDRMTLVVGERHLAQARQMVPDWWEIQLAKPSEPTPTIRTIRRGRQNYGRTKRALAELLWREDAISLLEEKNAAHGVKSKPRSFVWDRVGKLFKLDEIAQAVRNGLRAKKGRLARR